jgi:hypothetical protein
VLHAFLDSAWHNVASFRSDSPGELPNLIQRTWHFKVHYL